MPDVQVDAPEAPAESVAPAGSVSPEPASEEAPERPVVPEAAPGQEPALQDNAPITSPEDGIETAAPVAGAAPSEPAGSDPVARPEAPDDVPGAAAEPAPDLNAASDTPPEAETALQPPAAPVVPDTAPPAFDAASGDSPERRDSALPAAPENEATPRLSTETPEPPLPAPLVPGEEALPRVSALPGTVAREDEDTERRGIGTPVGSLIDRDASSDTGRLPSIGDEAADAPPQERADDAVDAAELPPLLRYAIPVEVEADAPRMSIVLIDDGTGPLGPDTVGTFPFPVSFAIPASHPDAAAAARGYRAAGFEVLAIAGVPEGAQAADVEVTLEGSLGAVPEAVAVLEAPGAGLQGARAISEQAARYLGASGHGLLMQPKGLNTGEALARREEVPALTVFRDFDGEGQDPRVMRRFLDQAAFKARQEGAVVMLGRLRADTVSALLLWGLQDRASRVALVPISLVLQESTTSPG